MLRKLGETAAAAVAMIVLVPIAAAVCTAFLVVLAAQLVLDIWTAY